ncbi:MAG: aminotransferase class V-fold PLP-dependent enzyme [Candidatus Promineofilum sp.]|uniref:aminotransferase class V-fold PLP-dependent enzyme n=1 Tax=Promineifilum sp. TaxID=2664178 RepID=UPI00241208AE|nr:aminotransferase class V-fold PLP-dependent enzyme [Promineifilum sp.]
MTQSLRDEFLLDPDVVFLNHGSFGATPRPVFEAYRGWQQRLEWQPVQFLGSDIGACLAEARAALALYLKTGANDLVYVPNATFGINVVARSLRLGSGDEVLATDHEYGACENAWLYMSRERGFRYVRRSIPLPLPDAAEIVEQFWAGVTPRTKVIFLSHITSPTAVRFPVEAICARARRAGILTVVDGAHAPGQIPLDLNAVGADFYAGNCHKWLCAPKGAGFLHARPEVQRLIEPLVVGWGWGERRTFAFGSDYLDYLQYPGTDDYAAYLAVPAAIEFQARHDWPTVRARCHELVACGINRINELTGLSSIYGPRVENFSQMAAAPLPPIDDLPAFKQRLYGDFRVEIPCVQWGARQFIRISIQGYNTETDVDALLAALEATLVSVSGSTSGDR